MDRLVNKIAVVTGSGSGIGACISKKLVQHGVIVVGLDKNYEKLQIVEKEISEEGKLAGKFHSLKCNVTKEDEVDNSFKWISSELGPVSILVNNAGIGNYCYLSEISGDLISRIFDTNVKANIICAKEAIKIMDENSIHGHIINIDSIVGHYIVGKDTNFGNGTMINVYTSSKQALRVISEGLRRELVEKKSNIKVTNLSPGRVKTDLTTKILPKVDPVKGELQPESIADACIYVLNTPPEVVISELTIVPLHQSL